MGENVLAVASNIRAEGEDGAIPWSSANVGPKGSCRLERFLALMRRHLQPMEEGRQWRILMCDMYSAHLDEEVAKCATEHGYVLVYHGGGCTGVLQCNDTRLHQ